MTGNVFGGTLNLTELQLSVFVLAYSHGFMNESFFRCCICVVLL